MPESNPNPKPNHPQRRTPQQKVSIPPGEWPAIEEAMEWDGVKNFSQFALAAIRQRVRRIKREKAREDAEGS